MSTKNILSFSILALIWGSSFLWIKLALQEIGPFMLVTLRVSFALLGLLAIVALRRPQWPALRPWLPRFLVIGLANAALPFVLISSAEQYISSGMAAILNSTVPFFTMIFGAIFLTDERFTWSRLAGLLLGFAGVVSLTLGGGQVSTDLSTSSLLGVGLMLAASATYGGAAVYARRRVRGLPAEVQSIGQMSAALLFMLLFTPLLEAPIVFPTQPITWLAVAFLGVLGSGVATFLFFTLLNSVGPTRTTLVTYFFPLAGVALGALFLGEQPGWEVLLGGALILSGAILVNRK